MHRHVLAITGFLLTVFTFQLPSVAAEELSQASVLAKVIQDAERRHRTFTDQVTDYTCTLVKRERINGHLFGHEYAEVKLRHRQVQNGQIVVPFSVYVKFLAPADLQGREVIYVEGRNDGKLIARRGGRRFAYVTTAVVPLGDVAMERNRYPITHMGIQALIEELLAVGQEELENPPDELLYREVRGVKIDGRACHMIEFTHPIQREQYRYHVARIFVDEELDLPVRHAAYDWPDEEGGKPVLLEEFTYVNLRLNADLTDWDFDHRNEEYRFLKEFQP